MSAKTITAEELARSFEKNPNRAEAKYIGETLEIRGEVRKIDNVISAVVVRLDGIGQKYNGTHVEVKLRSRSDVEGIASGDTVTFRGHCDGIRTKTSPNGEDVKLVMLLDADRID